MAPGIRRVRQLRRTGHLCAALLRSTAGRPAAGPLKITFCLTYRCQYRCKTCNIWQRQPQHELSTDEIGAFVQANPRITWVDLTGGEIFLRPDIDAVLQAAATGWKRLAILHFPTNGFLTDRIVRAAERLAVRSPARTIVTVSLDGDEETNDELRGIRGGFTRQIATFKALRRIRGITVVFGVTVSSYNAGSFARIFDACARHVPDLSARDVHVNIAQTSDHFYGNAATASLAPEPSALREDLQTCRELRGRPRWPSQLLEHVFLKYVDRFLATGRTPMPCHALRASCFVDPEGVVYPCSSYSRPIGSLRDAAMRLEPLWAAHETRRLQSQIWDGDCPQCWTACEAYQSILGNVLAGRWRHQRAGHSGALAAVDERGP